MGAQQKRSTVWRFSTLCMLLVLACLMSTIGLCVVNYGRAVVQVVKLQPADSINEIDRYWGVLDGGIISNDIAHHDQNPDGTTTWHIRTPGELSRMCYMITFYGAMGEGSITDYAGDTFVLENDIDLSEIEISNDNYPLEKVYPYWTPVDIGENGKNHNIIFDGNHYSIIGMRIKCDSDSNTTGNLNAGFFANMIGGVFKDVTFENPEIVYNYRGTSVRKTDPNRPTLPTDICVGVIAGEADSTYISNVDIVNPKITFNSEDVNAHNFYVGTAVGKLSFTRDTVTSSINTVSPKRWNWGIDTVNVLEDSTIEKAILNPTVMAKITHGLGDTTYGIATNLYFGGLVGANISSKIINSTLRDFALVPDVQDEALGNYYVGGLAGLTTQITSAQNLIVAAGLYNNLLIDVKFDRDGKITGANINDTRYCGNLVGRIYSGGWVYNNMIIGEMPYNNGSVDIDASNHYERLWENIINGEIRFCSDLDHCISHINGALDPYYTDDTFHYLDENYDQCRYEIAQTNGETYVYCSRHQNSTYTLRSDGYGVEEEMAKYNYHFLSLNDPNFLAFINDNEYQPDGAEALTKFDLLSSVIEEHGYAYFAARAILKYERGLTVPVEVAQDQLDDLLTSVNQFRIWKLKDGNNEPSLDEYFGLECTIRFVANYEGSISNSWVKSNAHFELDNGYGGYNTEPVYEETLTFQQVVKAPVSEPVCDGYNFLGWRIQSLADDNSDFEGSKYYPYLTKDGNGYYIFGNERIIEQERVFVAIWAKKKYDVKYMLAENEPYSEYPTELQKVAFNATFDGPSQDPVSNEGYGFVGWFLKDDVPTAADGLDYYETKKWRFGQKGTPMPIPEDDTALYLYAGWVDNFSMLRSLIEVEDNKPNKYVEYNNHYDEYFDTNTGVRFHNAFEAAQTAIANSDTSNVRNILTELQAAYLALRVNPRKILETPAFEESKTENTCPFLYDYDAYLQYSEFKKWLLDRYVDTDVYENFDTTATQEDQEIQLKNIIEAYIKNYEKINEFFDALQTSPNSSVAAVGGVDAGVVRSLIEQYKELETAYESYYTSGEYAKYEMEALDKAKKEANEIWSEYENKPSLADVQSKINTYQAAFRNLQLKSTTSNETEEKKTDTNSNNKMGVSPIVLGIIIVSILATGVVGYIGIDVVLNKHRAKVNAENAKTKRKKYKDDETYV